MLNLTHHGVSCHSTFRGSWHVEYYIGSVVDLAVLIGSGTDRGQKARNCNEGALLNDSEGLTDIMNDHKATIESDQGNDCHRKTTRI